MKVEILFRMHKVSVDIFYFQKFSRHMKNINALKIYFSFGIYIFQESAAYKTIYFGTPWP